ncbi:hypothetical protein DW886_17520 [Enterocloster aldenensis]|uniref:hypothetical protein n=1 Tax=Enterocloster aldenensis TaxID=358742 RepID=UPI000E48B571|nr:hypothetical protein DW886_17520 [Enterocloster aldenensis]
MNRISSIIKIKKEIDNDPTLTSLIKNEVIKFIASSTEKGYENYSVFEYYLNDKSCSLSGENLIILEYCDDGTYKFVSELEYNKFLWLDLDMSNDATELRKLIYRDETLDTLEPGTLKCLGHYANAYRLWLFQYKNTYVLLGDLGNGHYSFYKEVKDLSEAPVDY